MTDKRIAEITGNRFSNWERHCTPTYIWNICSPVIWCAALMVIMLAVLFFGSLALGFQKLNNFFFGAVVTFECLILIGLVVWAGLSRSRVMRGMEAISGNKAK